MESPDNRIDLQYLREVVRKFMKDNRLHWMTELGRVLNPEITSSQGQGDRGRRFFEDDYYPDLQELGRLSDWMGCSYKDLLRPISQITMGDHSNNFSQNGDNTVVNITGEAGKTNRVAELSEGELIEAAKRLLESKRSTEHRVEMPEFWWLWRLRCGGF